MNILSKLQNTIISLKQGHVTGQNKEEEICSYRVKQTKNRKTILINCRDCNKESSLNDSYCRKNILSILRKEVHADCLVLSRLYERDYEGKALASLYVLASFEETITAYRSIQRVPEACNLPEKKDCDLEREELIRFFNEIVKIDPLKARLEVRKFSQRKMLRKAQNTEPTCTVYSEYFNHILQEIEEKLSRFPEIPVLKKAELRYFSSNKIENLKKKTENEAPKTATMANLIEDTSGEITLTAIPKSRTTGQSPPEHIPPEQISPEKITSEHIPPEHTLLDYTLPDYISPEQF